MRAGRSPLPLSVLAAALISAAAAPPASAEEPADPPPPPAGAGGPSAAEAAGPPGAAAAPEPATPPGGTREAGPEGAPAGGSAPAAEAPPEPPPPDPSVPPRDPSPPPYAEDTWLDVGHAFLEERMFAPVLRLDRFFSDERELEAERARSFLRVRNAVRVHQHGTPAYALDVRASLRLPGLNRQLEKVRLVIAGQAEDVVSGFYPELAGEPLGPNQKGTANAELRYGAWDGLYSHVDLGAGLLLELPIGAFTRLRYRASVPLGRWVLGRMALAGFWRTDTRLGTSLDASAERPVRSVALVRLSGAAKLTQRSRGVEWSTELAGLRALGPRMAVSLAAGMDGATDAPTDVERYRVYARFRRDLFRRWIFYELEPEVAWPWEAERGGRFREFAITLRLEVQIQGNEPPVEPPADLPEPRDPPHVRPARQPG